MVPGEQPDLYSGKVADKETGKPLAGVSVSIKGTIAGTITSDSGSFSIRTKTKFPLTLVFTSVDFSPRNLK